MAYDPPSHHQMQQIGGGGGVGGGHGGDLSYGTGYGNPSPHHQDDFSHYDDYHGNGNNGGGGGGVPGDYHQDEHLRAPLTSNAAPPGLLQQSHSDLNLGLLNRAGSTSPHPGMPLMSRQDSNTTYDSSFKYGGGTPNTFQPGDVVFPNNNNSPYQQPGSYPPPPPITPGAFSSYSGTTGGGGGNPYGNPYGDPYAGGAPVNFNGGMEYPQGWNGGGQQWVQARDQMMRSRVSEINLFFFLSIEDSLGPSYEVCEASADPRGRMIVEVRR